MRRPAGRGLFNGRPESDLMLDLTLYCMSQVPMILWSMFKETSHSINRSPSPFFVSILIGHSQDTLPSIHAIINCLWRRSQDESLVTLAVSSVSLWPHHGHSGGLFIALWPLKLGKRFGCVWGGGGGGQPRTMHHLSQGCPGCIWLLWLMAAFVTWGGQMN